MIYSLRINDLHPTITAPDANSRLLISQNEDFETGYVNQTSPVSLPR